MDISKMTIDKMRKEDEEEVIGMMRTFYSSPAVHTNGSEEIFRADVTTCTSQNPYLHGFVWRDLECLAGYAMVAQCFSTEFGKKCVWIEDVYIRPEYRGLGLGKKLMRFLENRYQGRILRLEVEEDNKAARRLYLGCGFEDLPYKEMMKEAK